MVETLSKNITRQGLTATTLNYLRVSSSNITSLEDASGSGQGGGGGGGGVTEVSGPGPGPGGAALGGAAQAAGATPTLDPDSLPLPSAHTLPGGPAPDMDFGADNFQFQ